MGLSGVHYILMTDQANASPGASWGVPQAIADEVLAAYPPFPEGAKLLYHYTSPDGLRAILSDGIIWATDTYFLNDRQELHLALDILAEVLEEETSAAQSRADRPTHLGLLLTMAREFLEERRLFEVYVTSFSMRGNLLSQWRGYCPSSGGYSIGFDADELVRAASANGFIIGACIYDPVRQRSVLRSVVVSVIKHYVEWTRVHADDSIDDVKEHRRYFAALVGMIAPLIKHEEFREEAEWRVASANLAEHPDRYGTRPARGLLVPYYKFKLTDGTKRHPVRRIFVGPQAEQEAAERGVHRFIAMKPDLDGVEVTCSKIPFRS
jgi:hypothetical protein